MNMVMFSLVVLTMSTIVGCEDAGTPVSESSDIDPQLFGAWYYLDTLSSAFPRPATAFYGMLITGSDTIRSLGIDIASGRVALLEERPARRLLYAPRGVVVIESDAPGGTIADTMQYRMDRDVLTLTDRYRSTVYHRTQLGSTFCRPVLSVFTVNIDTVSIHNPTVAAYPSAYVSVLSARALRLLSYVPNGWITIDIGEFSGVGTYAIGPNDGTYMQWLGDYGRSFGTDSLSSGTITIDRYDAAMEHCSGGFAFTARRRGLPGDPVVLHRLSDGVFSVPVYHK